MATNYPSGLDSLSNPAGSDALSTGHASQHANANDAIEAIEGELGLNPRGGSATVKARFDAIEANSWVTSARIADGTIVDADINASAAIAGTKLADGAITPIKTSAGYVGKSTAYPITNDDRVLDVTGTTTVTLPTSVSNSGRTFHIRNSGSATVTIATTSSQTIDGASTITLAGKGFAEVVSDGANWRVLRGQYADESVGRRIWTWNHAYSTTGGWQRTFADTGWRDISALATNFGSGFLYLRRVNDRVSIITNGLVIAAGQVGKNIDGTIIVAHTSGFEPAYIGIESQAIINQSGGYWQQVATNNSASDIRVRRMYRMGADYPTTWASGGALYLEKSYSTTVSWPTSLPGSAAGSIPT